MKSIEKYFLLAISAVLLVGCIEPYDLPVRDEDVGFLVVDGFVNTNNHSATVVLSRAIPLASSPVFPRELNASVSIEEEGGPRYQLIEEGNGTYRVVSPDFVSGKRYRLKITTASRKDYASAYITTKTSPPIDSLSWTATPEGVTIKLDTEDPSNKTKYYRWEYIETWKYDAAFSSEYEIINGVAVARIPENQIKYCYATETSSEIITGSTASFTTDKFVDQEITFIPYLSPKTRLRYSVLVKQFALSKEAYDYWQQLSVNTESLGGLFDPQPSQLRGNITRTDDNAEPVIGYFDGGGPAERRLFINYLDLPDYLQRVPPNPNCSQEFIKLDSVDKLGNFHLLTNAVYWGIFLAGYNYSTLDCVDCRRQGGTTEEPSFW